MKVLLQSRSVDLHNLGQIYSCQMCDYITPRKDHLQRHNLIHTGEKPFQCTICYKSFNQKCSLKVHYKIHLRDNLALQSNLT
ncbi:Zinc finger protein 865 like protein [Argiope bruennichi]|uniref:Zinc finger protein 865 like protein n=1 Tax=Argiope bruennichi TaxID=94029 RepID=A0A8T0EHD5_ARGBR|nr:Zinc finger protein 865 like protein [Argiope bruennichi]